METVWVHRLYPSTNLTTVNEVEITVLHGLSLSSSVTTTLKSIRTHYYPSLHPQNGVVVKPVGSSNIVQDPRLSSYPTDTYVHRTPSYTSTPRPPPGDTSKNKSYYFNI